MKSGIALFLGIHFIVEDEIKSSHTAEAVLKFAGLDKAF